MMSFILKANAAEYFCSHGAPRRLHPERILGKRPREQISLANRCEVKCHTRLYQFTRCHSFVMPGHETQKVILLIEKHSIIYDTCELHEPDILKQTLLVY